MKFTKMIREFERNLILKALINNGYNISKTSRELGLDRNSLYSKLGASNKETIKQLKETKNVI